VFGAIKNILAIYGVTNFTITAVCVVAFVLITIGDGMRFSSKFQSIRDLFLAFKWLFTADRRLATQNLLSLVYVCIIAPLTEEYLKRRSWKWTAVILAIETFAHYVTSSSYQEFWIKAGGGVFAHSVALSMPSFIAGTMFHSYWNSVVALREGMFDWLPVGRSLHWLFQSWADIATQTTGITPFETASVFSSLIKLGRKGLSCVRNYTGIGAPADVSPDVFLTNMSTTTATIIVPNKGHSKRTRGQPNERVVIRTAPKLTRRQKKLKRAQKISKNMTMHSRRSDVVAGGDRDVFRTMSAKAGMLTDYEEFLLKYAKSMTHPEKYQAFIPDWTTFPRALEQIRTVGTWAPDPNGNGSLLITPGLHSFAEVIGDSTVVIDGISYVNSTFDAHNYSAWTAALASFRMVSMSVTVKYIGSALNNKGTVATACIPPTFDDINLPTTYQAIAEYNYSYWGAARDGSRQVWFPASLTDFDMKEVDAAPSISDYPSIVVGFAGVETIGDTILEPQFSIEIVQNIEAFSTVQILTAPKQAARSDPNALALGLNTMSKAHINKMTSGPASSAESIYQGIMDVVPTVANFLWSNRKPIFEGASLLGSALL
jgi:hypothetical protein